MRKVTIVGCGDLGTRVARACLDRGDEVAGWVRSANGLARLKAADVPGLRVDLDSLESEIPGVANHLLYYFAPPPASGSMDPRVARLIQTLGESASPQRVVYLSTTGVYGDCQGEWVDETRSPRPAVDRSRRRLEAEERWRKWSTRSGGELVILRVAGIYGPGKLPTGRLQSGQPMVGEADSPITNHIHMLDLVEICLAAMQRGRSGEVYNVSDGHPGSMTGYFNQVADFLELPRPPVISRAEAEQHLSPGMLSYLAESRRLSNRKMLDELGVELSYPTLREGLPACLEGN